MQRSIKNVAWLEGVDSGITDINGSVNCDLLYIDESGGREDLQKWKDEM